MAGATEHMDMQTQAVRVDPLGMMELHGSAGKRLNRQIAPDLFSGIAESGVAANCVDLEPESSSRAGPGDIHAIEVRAAVWRPDASAMRDVVFAGYVCLRSGLTEGA